MRGCEESVCVCVGSGGGGWGGSGEGVMFPWQPASKSFYPSATLGSPLAFAVLASG